jgi:hypothetical protein
VRVAARRRAVVGWEGDGRAGRLVMVHGICGQGSVVRIQLGATVGQITHSCGRAKDRQTYVSSRSTKRTCDPSAVRPGYRSRKSSR